QLAHVLRTYGVGPEVPVALCMERSPGMIIGLLGILKAGGVYVPLDPSYPQERLAFFLQDTHFAVLLTQRQLLERLSILSQTGLHSICLDDAGDLSLLQQPTANPTTPIQPENLAYVMYTSGSTGRPKGVSVTHQNVVRLVKDTNYLRFGSEEIFLQLAPLA